MFNIIDSGKRVNQKSVKIICFVICVILLTSILYFEIGRFTPKKIFDKAINSVVEVKSTATDVATTYGTAVFIADDGVLITNAHVVTYDVLGEIFVYDVCSIRFATAEDYIPVKIVKYDIDKDLAVLKMENEAVDYRSIKIGNVKDLDYGEEVYAVGNALNYGLSITQGIISIPKLNIKYDNVFREVIQCDLTISPGNSGGALLDKKGRLIGITTFRTKDLTGNTVYGLAYSIPIDQILTFVLG